MNNKNIPSLFSFTQLKRTLYPIETGSISQNKHVLPERVIYRDSKAGIVSVSLDGQNVQQLNDDWEAFSITVDNIAG